MIRPRQGARIKVPALSGRKTLRSRTHGRGVNQNNMETVAVSLLEAAGRRPPARRTNTPGVPAELVRARFQACRKAEASGFETPFTRRPNGTAQAVP